MKTKLLLFVVVCNSTLGFSQNISINTSGATNTSLSMLEILQISATANSKGLYVTNTGGGASNYAAIFDQGNVGFGTTTPQTKLDVHGSAAGSAVEILRLTNDDNGYTVNSGAKLNFYYQDNTKNLANIIAAIQNGGDGNYGYLAFGTRTSDGSGVVEKMRIRSTGAVAFNGATNYGALNNVLISQGDAPPVWGAVPGGGGGGGSCFNNWQLYISGATSGMLGTGTPGSFTVPASITLIKVAVWGGGGGGGGGSNGSGGGGGGYAEGTYAVTAGTVYQITIGAAGGGGASTVSGTAGGTTCFSTAAACGGTILISASPGQPGLTGAGNAGGAGGIGSSGYLNTTLGQGGSSHSPLGAPGSNGGGYNYTNNASAGSAAGGGGGVGGGNANSFSGSSAQANSGAGGGGAYNGAGSGGNGASGKIIVYW